MDRYSEIKPQTTSGPHPDYFSNLTYANNLCGSLEGRLVEGMQAKVCGSQWLSKCLLTISWKPPASGNCGNFANSVNLHQTSRDFQKQAQETLETVKKTAERFLATQDTKKDSQVKFNALKA